MILRACIMSRFAWELLGFLRLLTLMVAVVMFVVGIVAVTAKVPWIIVRKCHALELANGDSWTFNTPFFWWHWSLTGAAFGARGCSATSARR